MAGEPADRDEPVLPATRRLAIVAMCMLLAALIALWGFPGRTPELWGWVIKPDLTPIFMGACYGAGAYFFLCVYRARHWHEVSIGVLSAAFFALLMLLKAIGYYDKFDHAESSLLAVADFYAWLLVFGTAPVLLGWMWWCNQRFDDGGAGQDDVLVPASVRILARAVALVALLAAAAVMVAPGIAVDNWGWTLTSLTARVLACFVAQIGVALLLLSWAPRWSSWRVLVKSSLVAIGLLLLGALRARDDFDSGSPMTWGYLVAVAGAGVTLLALYRSRERSVRSDRLTGPARPAHPVLPRD